MKPMDCFQTTRWDFVTQAGCEDHPEAAAALENLCAIYWKPLYRYARCRGNSEHDACDLVQGFFTEFLSKKYFQVADRRRGRFRSFLLICLKHYIADQAARSTCQRRGGHVCFVSMDQLDGVEAVGEERPDEAFDRAWGLVVLDTALARLRQVYDRMGKPEEYTVLKDCLTIVPRNGANRALGERLDISANAAGVAAHRFRRRYLELVRETVRDTVADPAELEDELRYLLRLVAGRSPMSGDSRSA